MRIAAPTITPGALLVGVGVLVGGILLVRLSSAASKAAGQAYDAAKDVGWAITPWNNENVISETVNGWLFDGNNSIGGWLYDVMNPEVKSYTVPGDATEKAVSKKNNQAPLTYDWSASTPVTGSPTFTITPGL